MAYQRQLQDILTYAGNISRLELAGFDYRIVKRSVGGDGFCGSQIEIKK